MTSLPRSLVESRWFKRIVIAAIIAAGVLAGLETSASLVATHGQLFRALDLIVIAIFIVEIVCKIAMHGRRPLDYFRDGWNVFDFTVVVVCLLPIGGMFASVLRLARVLRLLRLVSALPKLQLLVGALLKSLGAMGYVSLLLGLIFYIYAVAGVHLFGTMAPKEFGSLGMALMTLFQMITLDNWGDLFASARAAAPFAAVAYFVSFILLGTMIMLNLFIGIVMNSMSEMHRELDEAKASQRKGCRDEAIELKLAAIGTHLAELRALIANSGSTKVDP